MIEIHHCMINKVRLCEIIAAWLLLLEEHDIALFAWVFSFKAEMCKSYDDSDLHDFCMYKCHACVYKSLITVCISTCDCTCVLCTCSPETYALHRTQL